MPLSERNQKAGMPFTTEPTERTETEKEPPLCAQWALW
jgi:hypothetical protein